MSTEVIRKFLGRLLARKRPGTLVVVCRKCDKIIFKTKIVMVYDRLNRQTSMVHHIPLHIVRLHSGHLLRTGFWEKGSTPPWIGDFTEDLT